MSVTSPALLSPTSFATESLKGALPSKSDGEGSASKDAGEGGGDKIEQKEFFWDQFLTYMATIIALLTVLDVTLQFFRGGGLSCRVPSNGTVPTRDEVVFINTFCQQSLSRAEYYPLFVLTQGLLLAAPQYLWASLSGGEFDFFFGLVQQLDRLRERKTGQYRSQNFEIVDKLEKHFPRKWRLLSIFTLYVAKLGLQFVVIFIAIIVNGAFFQSREFSFTFKCPRDFDPRSMPEGWWLSQDVICVFTSFRLHRTIQNVNYLLLCLAFVAVLYGLIWCFTRHAKVLGYREIALFAFNSCLRPEDYVHSCLFKPRIMNDLDFLLMRLFQADSGCGNVFKDIQIERELRKEVRKDHEYLYILLDAMKDSRRARKRAKQPSQPQTERGNTGQATDVTRGEEQTKQPSQPQTERKQLGNTGQATDVTRGEEQTKQPSQPLTERKQPGNTGQATDGARGEEAAQTSKGDAKEDSPVMDEVAELYKLFREAKFNHNPGIEAYEKLGETWLGNVQWSAISGIRDFIYGFFAPVKGDCMALDISFGTVGYPLILSRAFQEVVSLNFHPFYSNDEEICRKDEFHTNYSTITFREDILSTRRESLRKVDETMLTLYRKDRGRYKEDIRNNLVIIGPITEEAKAATVNLFIERQQAAQRFHPECILLTVRPLRIGKKDVTSRFYKLIPQANLFTAEPMDTVKAKLKEDTGDSVKYVVVGVSEGIPMKCYKTECVFEILVYKFCGSFIVNRDPPPVPPPQTVPAPKISPRAKSVFEMPQPAPSSRITHRHKNEQHQEENRDFDDPGDEAIDITL